VARAALVLVGIGLGLWLLWTVHEVLFLLFLAILLSTAIEPLVNRLRRGPFGRGSGILVVYTALVIIIAVPTMIFAPTLVAQIDQSMATIPESIARLRPYAEQLRPEALSNAAVQAVDRVAATVQSPVPAEPASLVEVGTTIIVDLLEAVTVVFLGFYWLVERATIKRAVLRLVPTHRAREVNAVWLEVEEKLGGWVRGQLLVMIIMGTMAGVGFSVIGLPNPLLLALLAALGELIPMIGPLLGFAPAVVVALIVDPSLALIVVVYALVIQQIEGNLLVPRIMGHTVGVSPLTVVLGILIGSILYGLPGAFLAIPVAGAIQVIVAHALGMEGSVQAEAHVPGPSREAAQSLAPPQGPSTGQPTRPTPSQPTAITPSHTLNGEARVERAERMLDDDHR
jgi:predicted PurR-regulated permease PerM